MSKAYKNNRSVSAVSENTHAYGFVHKSETEKLRENIFRSDKEKFHLFVRTLKRSMMLKKVAIMRKANKPY